jgi:uncharacterized protein YjiS (DUF1127 family)
MLSLVTIIRDDGSATCVPWQEVSLADLLRAADEAILPGDPLRQYLIVPTGFGDFTGSAWSEVLEYFNTAWRLVAALPESEDFWGTIGRVADLGGASVVGTSIVRRVRSLKRRYRARRDVVEESAHHLDDVGLAPRELHRLLKSRSWSTDELERLLNCDRVVAEAIAWSQEMVRDETTGRWQYVKGEAEDQIVHTELHMAVDATFTEDHIRKTIAIYLRDGDAPAALRK